MSTSRTNAVAYWVFTVLAAVLFAVPGTGLLLRAPISPRTWLTLDIRRISLRSLARGRCLAHLPSFPPVCLASKSGPMRGCAST